MKKIIMLISVVSLTCSLFAMSFEERELSIKLIKKQSEMSRQCFNDPDIKTVESAVRCLKSAAKLPYAEAKQLALKEDGNTTLTPDIAKRFTSVITTREEITVSCFKTINNVTMGDVYYCMESRFRAIK